MILLVDDIRGFYHPADWALPVETTVLHHPFDVTLYPHLSRVACFLVDHRMPGMNGDALSHWIRGRSQSPIFKIGTFDEPGYPKGCIFLGKFLTKRIMHGVWAFVEGKINRDQLQDILDALPD
jgi:CheY-like chemotaxis protein